MGFFHVDEYNEIDIERHKELQMCLTNFWLYLKLRREFKKRCKLEELRLEKIHAENIEFFCELGQAKIAENYEKFLQSEENTERLEAINERQKIANTEFVETKARLTDWRLAILNNQKVTK